MIIGITGGFGTGKSTVAKMFEDLGAKVIDADKIAHSILGPAKRKKIAEVVFRKKKYLDLLCKILHPLIIYQIKKKIKTFHQKKNIIVIDAPLLIETGLDRMVDFLIVVKAKRKTQIERIRKRMGLSRKDILRRIRLQMPLRRKIELADFVVDNDGLLSDTRKQVEKIWQEII